MARKRKTLPRNFPDLLDAGDLPALKALFDTCLLDARERPGGQTALGFPQCPDDLARWLVAESLDVDAADSRGCTPLSNRARRGGDIGVLIELGADVNAADQGGGTPLHAAIRQPHHARTLIEHGAALDARNAYGRTPLDEALATCSNADLADGRAQTVQILLDAGATAPADAADQVRRIGQNFEFHRARFNPDYLDAAEAGLAALYAVFDVDPVPARRTHDGTTTITVADGPWQRQFHELWDYLVPSSGAAQTVQGETIRLSGRISREILDNGGVNWDATFRTMAAALAEHLASGTPVTDAAELVALKAATTTGHADQATLDRLAELAVAWVHANPEPIPLPRPRYRR